MPVLTHSQQRAQQLYEDMVDLLQELWTLASEEDGADLDEAEMVQDLIMEMEDRGMDGPSAERILKSIVLFRRKARED